MSLFLVPITKERFLQTVYALKPRRFRGLWFCILLIIFSAPYLSAAPGDPGVEPGPEVRLEYIPENPALNHIWTVTILADHPRPAEVQINPPGLSDSLVLNQIRTVGRRASADGRRWTAVEFLFLPQRTGPLSLGSFEVLIPGHRIMTAELAVSVLEDRENPRDYHPRLFWEPHPLRLRVGEAGELALRIQDWESGKALPLPRFQTTVPMEVLLEDLPLTERDRNLGRILRLRLIPLAEGPFVLGLFALQIGALSLEAPAIAITLLSAPVERAASPAPPPENPAASAPTDRSRNTAPVPVFPVFPLEGPALFHKGAEAAVEQARLLWEEARYAETLGVLRGGERDLMGGYSLSPLRRAAEAALGIQFTIEEKWRPRNLLLGISLGSLGLFFVTVPLALFYRYRRKNGVTSRSGSGYKIILPALIVAL
jgi:hypothetical protein